MVAKHQSKQISHVFVSYRGSRRELAIKISQAAREVGWTADTIEEYLEVPFSRDSPYEFKWLTERFSERIESGCTFIIMASHDADESHWVLWESLEGFIKAYRVIVYWVSGADPLKIVFPLPKFAYRLMPCPQAFIVDARRDPSSAVTAITRILSPSRRYRLLFRLQQIATTFVCMAIGLSPVTVLLITSVLSDPTATVMRNALLRPWVSLLLFWLSLVMVGVFYPSYGGPSRIAPDPIDRHIRLVTPGFTGWRWRRITFPLAFILACLLDGIKIFTVKSMSGIGQQTYVKALIFALILGWFYQRIKWKLFTTHIGVICSRLMKHYGVDLSKGMRLGPRA